MRGRRNRLSPMEDLPSFILAGIALTGSPGPANFGLAAAGAAFGVRRSLALFAGTLIGVIAVMLVTAAGLTGLILARPPLRYAVSLAGAAYMLYLAYRIGTAPPLGEVSPAGRAPGFVPGLLLGLGNPKAYIAMAALFSGFVLVRDRPVADAASKTAILIAMVIAVEWVWLLAGAALTRSLRQPALGRLINIGFALLLLASVALAFAL
jgi:threonine/homoserine/homoserine lactone efflux protein